MPGETGGRADSRIVVTLSPSAVLRAGSARGPGLHWITKLLGAIRRIAGMPDYAAHVEHLQRYHPERSIPTQRDFYQQFVRDRYGDGPTRCC